MEETLQFKVLPGRIKKELNNIMNNTNSDFIFTINKDNLRHIFVTMKGPSDTCYTDGLFKLELFLPKEYPFQPVRIRFLTKIYHPNIDFIGRICLDIIKQRWSPALQIQSVLLSIQVLLSLPNLDDPLNEKVANHWRTNPEDAKKIALEYTKKYAI
jgi:ubiquitin-conjugating enzyme E2 N